MPVGTPTKRSRWRVATTTITASTSDQTLLAAPGAGIKTYVTDMQATNSSASTRSRLAVKEDSTTVETHPLPAAGSGFEMHRSDQEALELSANTALKVATEVSVSSVYVSAQGYYGA